MGEIDEATFKAKIAQVKKAVIPKAHALVYGTEATAGPQSRAEYLEKYGCVRWTDVAMAAIAKECPSIIELGAGSGKVEKASRSRRMQCDRVRRCHQCHIHQRGREEWRDARGSHVDRQTRQGGTCSDARLSSDGPMACDCLAAYAGNTLVYVGEGVGGCNADDDFFHELLQSWTVVVDMASIRIKGAQKTFYTKTKAMIIIL